VNKIDSFILIGGKSSRLGTDKAFVELGGKTLAERAVANVQLGLSPERITMVAGSSTQFAVDAIIADVPFIFDLYEGRGPIGGLHAALAYARTSWIFVLACDYPLVSPQLIGLLAEKLDDEFGAVVPEQNDGRMQPLCGFYNVSIARPIVQAVLGVPRVTPAMHEIVAKMNPRIAKFGEYSHLAGAGNFFLNINTTIDLERARTIV